jgi:hypothetical protein
MKPRAKHVAIAIGLAGLTAVSWAASYDSFSMASMILYKNTYTIPLASTTAILLTAALVIAAAKGIESFAKTIVNMVEKDLRKKND